MSAIAFTYPTYDLSEHFRGFFRCLNPKPTFIQQASSQYNTIKGLIENRSGLAAELAPFCFLQGSYDQSTAIYTINDVDIVVLCSLWQPGSGASGFGYRSWDRNAIFGTIAAPLLGDGRYQSKVYYRPTSMCIKVDLGIKVEILPVVFKQGTMDKLQEPFRLWRPENNRWEDGYARYHQALLCMKNDKDHACGNFIPMVSSGRENFFFGVSLETLNHCSASWLVDPLRSEVNSRERAQTRLVQSRLYRSGQRSWRRIQPENRRTQIDE
jgi:hypothetical protein